jgi:hypothetical protein
MASPWSTVEHPDASGPGVIDLDAATFLLQWAVGGLFFMWLTGRRREVGIGYGWTIRITFGLMAVGGVVVGLLFDPVPVRDASAPVASGLPSPSARPARSPWMPEPVVPSRNDASHSSRPV